MIMQNYRVIHVCQNYRSGFYKKLFKNITEVSSCSQIVFYPYIAREKRSFTVESNVILKKGVPNIFRHFFLFRGIVNAYNLSKSIAVEKRDIIHCHTLFNDGLVGLILNLIYGCKVVISIRQSDLIIYERKLWLRPYLFFLKKNVSYFIALSPTLQMKFKSFKPVVIGNGIENRSIVSAPKKIVLLDKVKLLYIGRIIKRKNLDKIIDLYLSNTGKYALKIIGSAIPNTDWSNSLLKKISLLNIDHHQNLSHSEINSHLDLSDIFILPSSDETFGIVYLEALSRGVPIIYKKHTGVDGLFSRPVGFGVKNGSIEELESGIEYILNNYNELSANCLSEVVNHNWSNVSNRILAIYKKISVDV